MTAVDSHVLQQSALQLARVLEPGVIRAAGVNER